MKEEKLKKKLRNVKVIKNVIPQLGFPHDRDKSHFAFLLKNISLIGSDATLRESHKNLIKFLRSRWEEQGQNCPEILVQLCDLLTSFYFPPKSKNSKLVCYHKKKSYQYFSRKNEI